MTSDSERQKNLRNARLNIQSSADQADTLRRLMEERAMLIPSVEPELLISAHRLPACPPVLAIASGKGGVGKSFVAANVGALLARKGLRVMLVDADCGLANLDILFGVRPEVTLEEVLEGRAPLQSALIGIEANLWLLPSSGGWSQLVSSGQEEDRTRKISLARLLESCPWEMDVILLDSGAGISDSVLDLHHPEFHSLVVVTPEPTSMADAYALIKSLKLKRGISRFGMIVNQVADARAAIQCHQKLKDIAGKFLGIQLDYLGHVARDEKIIISVMKRKILLDLNSEAAAAKCLDLVAKRIGEVCLGLENETATEASGLSRLKDEPAQGVDASSMSCGAPGNTTRFFQTLLGEVRV